MIDDADDDLQIAEDDFAEFNRQDLIEMCTVVYQYDQDASDTTRDHSCSICLKDMERGVTVR